MTTEQLDVAGLCWTSWDMIQNLRRADLAPSRATDATRTERGFHAAGNKKPQVSGYSDGRGSAHCKTVGSAYVGSNPTPATTCENGPLAANSRASGPFPSCPVVYQGASLRVDAWQCARTNGVQRPGKTSGARPAGTGSSYHRYRTSLPARTLLTVASRPAPGHKARRNRYPAQYSRIRRRTRSPHPFTRPWPPLAD